MRIVLLLAVLVVIVGGLLFGFGVITLDGGAARRGGGDAEENALLGEGAEDEEGSRLIGRPGAVRADERLAAAAAAAAAAAEADQASRVQGDTRNGARLTGRIVEGEGRVPVVGATVRLGVSNALYAYLRAERRGRFDELEARTDEDGRFAFYDITPALGYVIRARAEGRPALSASKLDLRGRPALDLGDLVLREPATLVGRILDGDGVGVQGARVAVTWLVENPMMIVLADPDTLPETERLVLTDDQGAFRAEALEPGVKTIVIDAASTGQDAIRAFGLEAGETTTLPDVVLAGADVLAGRVAYDDGRPVAEARVFAGHDGSRAVRTVDTAEDGSWRLESLPEGTFTVGVLVPGLPLNLSQGIESGREDIATTLPTTGSLTGRVTAAATGEPVASFRLQVERTEKSGDFMMDYLQRMIDTVIGPLPVQNADGRFEITPVPPGSYRVRVEAEGFPAATSDVVDVGPSQATPVQIRLLQGHGLLGVVRGEEGQLVGGVRVYVAPAAVVEASRAAINPSVLEDWAEEERVAAVSDGEGAFALPPQTPGIYYLLLIHEDYQPTLVENVDLQREASTAMPMRLESAGRVEGRLVGDGGAGVQGQPVLLIFPDGAVYSLDTEAEGRFERKALPPGECLAFWYAMPRHALVQAFRNAADEATRMPAYEAMREAGASPLAIVPGRATKITLRTGPRVPVEGTLRVDGGPPVGATVIWVTNKEGGRGERVLLDATGRFKVLLPVGTYNVWAASAEGAWTATLVEVRDAAGQRLDLER